MEPVPVLGPSRKSRTPYIGDSQPAHEARSAGKRRRDDMTLSLPPLIERLVAAINRGDTEAFLDFVREMRITAP
jgi:hypothetical protein